MDTDRRFAEVAGVRPAGARFDRGDRRAPLREALVKHRQFGPAQTAGRFYPMACVALEVTQRCNLDCALCYLSDAAEMAHDVPLPILVRRVASIESHYGPGTPIQITGGDPTLRKVEDLEALCREIRSRGMRSCLMTNGIKATRALLERLAAAGLDDVAFHVDLTQQRPGHATEASLNAVRDAYIDRAAGLGLRIMFNTTVCGRNIGEVPQLARYFKARADRIALASFQLQAATGRGVLRERDPAVSPERVRAAVADGAGAALDFDAAAVGHEACNRYAPILVAGDVAVSPLNDRALVEDVFDALEASDRGDEPHIDVVPAAIRAALRRPGLALRTAGHALRLVWRLRRGLPASGGRIHRMAFHVHDFMDAAELARDRCECCVFMVATDEGPMSMCAHNAQRDEHVFGSASVDTPEGVRYWSPASGRITARAERPSIPEVPRKHLKGRKRARALSR